MYNILIVEDDPIVSGMYKDIFKGENYEVTVASDGEEGWNMAKQMKPSLILLDIMMPKLNGIQLLERLKQDPQTKGIPVIILTNLAGDRDRDHALKEGAVKYMIKSDYTPKDVTDTVGSVIAQTSVNIPGSEQSSESASTVTSGDAKKRFRLISASSPITNLKNKFPPVYLSHTLSCRYKI